MGNIQPTNTSLFSSLLSCADLTLLSLAYKKEFTEIHVITQVQKEWEKSQTPGAY